MSALARFEDAMTHCPLIAILRGLRAEEAVGVGDALVEAGFTLIEVPLNSPQPLESIALLAKRFSSQAVIGAGTVLSADDVGRIEDAGGTLIISPNTNPQVIAAAAARKLVSLPGVATPSEAFAALDAGATALKLFPAEGMSPAVLKAMRAVLPSGTRVLPVGGISPGSMASWREAGAAGFGLGSALYKAGASPAEVSASATAFVRAWTEMLPNGATQ